MNMIVLRYSLFMEKKKIKIKYEKKIYQCVSDLFLSSDLSTIISYIRYGIDTKYTQIYRKTQFFDEQIMLSIDFVEKREREGKEEKRRGEKLLITVIFEYF